MATFADSFESADVSAWDSSAGSPSVTVGAALVGTYGMACNAAGDYVVDNFTSTDRYRLRFYFDPNAFSMSNGEAVRLIMARDGSNACGEVRLSYDGSNYEVRASIHDGGSWNDTSFYDISDAPCWIEVDWYFADGTAGFVSLWVDGVLQETLDNLDADARNPDHVRFGWVSTGAGSPSGTLYLDHFESNDDGSEIGPAGAGLAVVSGEGLHSLVFGGVTVR